MQRSFVAKTTVNFPDFELYVRMGDILVYNAANDNSLTVYRSGAIIKTIRATSISIAAMIKTKMIEEVVPPAPKVTTPKPPVPSPAPKPAPKPKAPPKPPAPKKVKIPESKESKNRSEYPLETSEEKIPSMPPAPPAEDPKL